MNRPLVSILVPVYNVEQYLDECLTSLVNQTFRDIEIIIVNDGSTDKSGDIADGYCAHDARVRLIDRENKGLGAARNAALFYARGEYILFVDSDDYLDLKTVEILYNKAEEMQTDILVYNGRAFTDNSGDGVKSGGKEGGGRRFEKKLFLKLSKKNEGAIVSGLEFASSHDAIASPCVKFFRRAFLSDNNLSFPEGVLGEDMEFNWRSMIAAERVSYTHFAGYFRRYRTGSIMIGDGTANIKSRTDNFYRLAALIVIDDLKPQPYNELMEKLASKMAMYACGLWVVAMCYKDKAAREELISAFFGHGIDGFIRRYRRGFFMRGASMLMSMPDSLNLLKRLACVTVRRVFRGRTDLFV